MAQQLFEVSGGFFDGVVNYLSGTGVPGADASYQDAAPVGSYYSDAANGETYKKVSGGAGTNRWDPSPLGDMASSVYDPTGRAVDAFAMGSMVEGVSAKILTGAERVKLAGVSEGATVNSADLALLDRVNHTGTQKLSTISDFPDATLDAGYF